MNISAILKSEDNVDVKLSNIIKVVTAARKIYGNQEATITSPDINTVDGMVDMAYVTTETKLSLVANEISRIKAHAIEFSRSVEGANAKSKVVELISTSPILTNLSNTENLDYI